MWYLDGREMISFFTRSTGRLGPAVVALAVLLSVAGGVVGGVAVDGTESDQSLDGVQASSHTGLEITPDHIDFGEIPPGARITTDITVSNTADEAIEIGGVEFTGDTDAFEVVRPATIKQVREFDQTVEAPPNTTQDIEIAFAPDSPGEYEATFTVFGPDGETLVSMTAVGSAAAPDTGEIRASPQSLTFEGTTVGSTATRTVSVSNVGNASLSVSSAITGSDAYSVASGENLSLGPGEQARVTVAFTPESTASQTALLELRSSDPDQPVTPISLSNSKTRTEVSTTQQGNNRQMNISVQNVEAGEPVDVQVPSSGNESDSVDIQQISVTPSRSGNLSLNVADSPDPLSTTPEFRTGDNATGMRYLNVSHSIPNSDIESVQYRFRVRKDRVASLTAAPNKTAGANPDAVTMYRYDAQTGWVEQNTTRVATTGTHYVYVTTGTGFSEWTTAAKRPDIRVADATAGVTAAKVGDTVDIQVSLTNDGGADGVFLTELLLNGSVVDDRRVTVPDGGTVGVTFERPFDQPGTYEVQVNDVPVDVIEVTSEGVQQRQATANQSGDDSGSPDDGAETPDDSGLFSSLPLVLGVGAVLLVGALGGLRYTRGGGESTEAVPDDQRDDEVIQTEGFDDATADHDEAGVGEGESPPDGETDRGR